jgi:hypothetical protein
MQRLLGENTNMTRGVLFIALLAALILTVLYFGYGSYSAKRAGASGDVYSNDSTSGRLKPSTDTDSSTAAGTRAVGGATTEATKPVTYPPAAEQAARADDTAATSSTDSEMTMPATDSISPHPPNGKLFAGTGKYQLYRQGNLTWRLNTDTGQTCIVFATDEEWKKPRVMKAGCPH